MHVYLYMNKKTGNYEIQQSVKNILEGIEKIFSLFTSLHSREFLRPYCKV